MDDKEKKGRGQTPQEEEERRPQEESEPVGPPLVGEYSLERIEADDVDIEEDLAPEQVFDTQHGEGHTYNPQHAADQGLTYTPPTDPPVVSSRDDPQGAEIAAGFAPSMEEAGPDVRDLPSQVDNNDLDLQEDIYQILRYNSETAHLKDIEVQVVRGVVTLWGTVLDENDIGILYDIVHDLEGVVEVRFEEQ
jgi:hypothetical protein